MWIVSVLAFGWLQVVGSVFRNSAGPRVHFYASFDLKQTALYVGDDRRAGLLTAGLSQSTGSHCPSLMVEWQTAGFSVTLDTRII